MELITAIVGVVGSIAGILIGFALSEGSTRLRQQQADVEQAQSARMVMRIEIDRNLVRLQSFRKEVAQEESKLPKDAQGKWAALRNATLPLWSHTIWESQISVAAKALTEEEIKGVLSLHSKLDNLSKIHAEFLGGPRNTNFSMKLYNDFFNLADNVEAKNNPIKN